jgi:hypothetical protein
MQTDLDDSEAVLPELYLPKNQLCDIEIGETDVEDVLSILNPSKASGQNLSILNLAIHSMNVEINSLFNLFLVSETIKSICSYNCNEKNLKNRKYPPTYNMTIILRNVLNNRLSNI